MEMIRKVFSLQNGFALLSVVFLTLITSFSAIILLNITNIIRNPSVPLELTALHLANEQFAQLESLAASGELSDRSYPFLGLKNDLLSENFSIERLTEFEMETIVSSPEQSLRSARIKITWILDEREFEIEFEKIIRVVD